MQLSKKFIEEQKQKLERKKEDLEKELENFAIKDPKVKGNWKTRFPDFGTKTADRSEEEDQVEEYEATLPVEYALETNLKKIEAALGKINKKTYGICQKCRKKIEKKRLKACPEAELCIKCSKT